MSKKIIRGGTIVTAVDTVQRGRPHRRRDDRGRRQLRRRRRRGAGRDRLLRACRARSTTTPTSRCRSAARRPPTTTTPARRPRRRAATTCLVDFALQMEPGRAALLARAVAWAAPRAPRTSTTASTWRSRRPTPARSPTWRRWSTRASRRSRSSSPTRRADGHRRPLPGRARAHQGDRRPRDGARRERLRASTTSSRRRSRPATPTRSTTRSRGPRSSRPRRPGARSAWPSTRARRSTSSTSPASAPLDEVIAARARGVAGVRRDLHPVPVRVDRRPAPARTSRARATSARRRCATPANQPHMWDALNFDHLQSISTDHCPFTDEQKRLGFGDFSKIPNGLAAIQHRAAAALGARRQDRPHDAEPLRRGDVDRDREDLRPRTRTRARSRPGADADIVIFDPEREHVFSTDTSLMNVDYDLWDGQKVSGSPRQTLSRGTVVFDDGKIVTQPGPRPLRQAQRFQPAVAAGRLGQMPRRPLSRRTIGVLAAALILAAAAALSLHGPAGDGVAAGIVAAAARAVRRAARAPARDPADARARPGRGAGARLRHPVEHVRQPVPAGPLGDVPLAAARARRRTRR